MISILVEVMEIPLRNTIVNDLFESFGQVNLEDCTNIKLKKTRRKHFKELTRLKKLGVLGNKSTSSYENRNKNQRKMSEKRVDNVLIINQPVDTKLNGKRNSHINFKESKSQSSNALLPKYHQSKLSVSAERSSGNRDSQIDHSNGDQGTRMDSPLLNSSNKEIAKESSKGEEIVLPTQNVNNNLQTQRRQSRNELSRSKKSIPNLQSQIEQEKEKTIKKKKNIKENNNVRISISRAGTRNRIRRNEKAFKDNKELQTDNMMHAKEQTYFLNVKINNEQDKNCDEQSNQVGSRSPAPEDNESQEKIKKQNTVKFEK